MFHLNLCTGTCTSTSNSLLLRILRTGQWIVDWVFDNDHGSSLAGLLFRAVFYMVVVIVFTIASFESATFIGGIFLLKLGEINFFFWLLAIILISVIIIGSRVARASGFPLSLRRADHLLSMLFHPRGSFTILITSYETGQKSILSTTHFSYEYAC